jgi:hypothetical protein
MDRAAPGNEHRLGAAESLHHKKGRIGGLDVLEALLSSQHIQMRAPSLQG